MSDPVSTDSHESASLAKTPSVASVDGWEVESSSAVQPTNEELADRLREEPVAAEASADVPEPVDEDHDDAPAGATPAAEMERGEDGKFTKKRKLTARERKDVLQAEFNALTKQREDARRAFEAEEAERRQRRAAPTPPAETPRTPAAASAATTEAGEPDWDAYEADGKTFSQYQKDHTAWARKTITAEVVAESERRTNERLETERSRDMARFAAQREDARVKALHEKYPDIAERAVNLDDVPQAPVITSMVQNHPAGNDLLNHLADHPAEAQILATFQWTRPMWDALKSSPDPTPLLSYWANHPEDHARIAHLDPVSALMALGRLSAVLFDSGAKTGSPGRTPPVTAAKPPIRPLGATRSAATSGDGDDDLEFGPAYLKRENERRQQRLSTVR